VGNKQKGPYIVVVCVTFRIKHVIYQNSIQRKVPLTCLRRYVQYNKLPSGIKQRDISTGATKVCNTNNFYIFVTNNLHGEVYYFKFCFSEKRGRLIFGWLKINMKMVMKSKHKN
jgi:hypothetical protein